jgi:ferric-dicitrate binding protein FerR (iron transport regulator)
MPRLQRLSLVALLAVGVSALGVAVGLAKPIGQVTQERYAGAVGMVTGGSEPEELVYDHPVHSDEMIQTGAGGTAMKLIDQTRLAVGAHSTIRLDRFIFDPQASNGQAAINLTRGLLRLTSGSVKHDGDLSIGTPVATLTIRGTDVFVKVEPDGTTLVDLARGLVELRACHRKPITIHAGQSVKVPGDCASIMVSNDDDHQTNKAVGSVGALAAAGGGSTSGGSTSGGSTSGGSTSGGSTGGSKPGNGKGDGNHDHGGPPGQNR